MVRIHQALRSPLRDNGLEFNETALQNVVSVIQEEFNIPIKLDTTALDDLGVQPDQAITINLHGISLRAALRLMLKEIGLTYIIQDEVLLITTPDEAEQQLRVCVYDVRDLIDATNPADMESLKNTILSCAATETWAANGGGEAEARPFRQSLLIVSQTQAVHEEVRALLDTIRTQLGAQPPPPPQPARRGTSRRPTIPKLSHVPTSFKSTSSPAANRSLEKVRDLITSAIPDVQWDGRLDTNEPVVLTVLPDRVVLRHRQSVQDKVQALLADSGLAVPTGAVAGEGRGRDVGGIGGGGGGFFNPQP